MVSSIVSHEAPHNKKPYVIEENIVNDSCIDMGIRKQSKPFILTT